MIVCDGKYLRELERQMRAARKALPPSVANAIDAEIEAIEAQGDPSYGTAVRGLAFRMKQYWRTTKGSLGFQGNLRRAPIAGARSPMIANWFEAMAVNKSTIYYQTWVAPDDAIQALRTAHRIARYRTGNKLGNNQDQKAIDRWRLKNGKVL